MSQSDYRIDHRIPEHSHRLSTVKPKWPMYEVEQFVNYMLKATILDKIVQVFNDKHATALFIKYVFICGQRHPAPFNIDFLIPNRNENIVKYIKSWCRVQFVGRVLCCLEQHCITGG